MVVFDGRVAGWSAATWLVRRRSAGVESSWCPPFERSALGLGSIDVRAAVGALGREVIVGSAEDANVFFFRDSTLATRVEVVELEPGLGVAAGAVRVDPAAGEAVAIDHGASDRMSDVR